MDDAPKSEVKEFYRGKTVLVTGSSGFVGKVLLEKIVRSLPDIKRIYLMIRPKPNMTLMQRVHHQIFSTQLFAPLFRDRPDFNDWINEKIIPIQGDLVLNELGIKPEDRLRLVEEVDIILNGAASINFNDPMHESLQTNYFGSLRVQDLAKECKHLVAMVHVSTAFTNCN